MQRPRLTPRLALSTLLCVMIGCGTATTSTADTSSAPFTDANGPADDASEPSPADTIQRSTDIEADMAVAPEAVDPLPDTGTVDPLPDTGTVDPLPDTGTVDPLPDTEAEGSSDVPDDSSTPSDVADAADPEATICDATVLALTQDNPQQFEFYELCVDTTGASEATLQAIDATLYCGVSGMFAGCKSTNELGCHGDLVYAAPGTKAISDAGWATLCALSAADGVRIIAGGYWL
jgi:hypothetical protein